MLQRITLSILLLLGIAFTPSGKLLAHVDKTYFLKGKVGERAIAIKMLNYDETRTRHLYYFFLDDKQDRFLTGTYQNKSWLFTTETPTKQAVTLNITDNINGTWKGIWKDSSGNNLDVVLTTLTADSISTNFSNLSFVTELDPYERYRLANMQFTKIKSEPLTKQLTTDWYVEQASGITFFRLRHNNKNIKTDSINAVLATMHLTYLQQYYAYNIEKKDSKLETIITYKTNQLISLKIIATTVRKQLPALQTRQLVTLNIASGLQVNLEDIVWFDKAENKPDLSNLFSVYKYRKAIFAPKIYELLLQLYPIQMQSSSCNINKVETWVLPDWCLTNQGLALGFRNEEGCDVFGWATLPYGTLAPYITNAYKYLLKVK